MRGLCANCEAITAAAFVTSNDATESWFVSCAFWTKVGSTLRSTRTTVVRCDRKLSVAAGNRYRCTQCPVRTAQGLLIMHCCFRLTWLGLTDPQTRRLTSHQCTCQLRIRRVQSSQTYLSASGNGAVGPPFSPQHCLGTCDRKTKKT
jgi:hypothetical protein